MKRDKLSLDALSVESFVIGTGGELLPAYAGAPTHRCDTRLTICTVPPME
jgi:hypothetical protein